MRPTHPRAAEHWDRGVRAVERYRLDHDLPDDVPSLGPVPEGPAVRDHQRAADELATAQRRLGREPDRSLERYRGLER